MESEIVNILKEINANTDIIKPITHLNVVSFELPLNKFSFEIENISRIKKISADTYNGNKEMFENFKKVLLSSYRDPSNIKPLSEDVYISICESTNNGKFIINIEFNY